MSIVDNKIIVSGDAHQMYDIYGTPVDNNNIKIPKLSYCVEDNRNIYAANYRGDFVINDKLTGLGRVRIGIVYSKEIAVEIRI